MLYFALVLGTLMLVLTNRAARRPDGGLKRGLAAAVGFSLCPIGWSFISPTVVVLGIVLGVLLTVTAAVGRPRLYLPLSLVAFAGVFGYNVWRADRSVEDLLRKYPFESITDRLPDRPPGDDPPSVPTSVTDSEDGPGYVSRRGHYLRLLHEDTTRRFVNQPNFGVARMMHFGVNLQPRWQTDPVPQPAERVASAGAVGESGNPVPPPADLGRMHAYGVDDFAHPAGFGHVRSREQVAGFEPHRFTESPAPPKPLKLRALDLIGLVVRPEPTAYVSANLPRMDELRTAPTRPLTAFEAAGLAKLRAGDDLYAEESAGGVRLLGAVRAAKQCVACHGGRRGDLLGAFSYELTRTD